MDKVTVYLDTAAASRSRLGGFFRMWLVPLACCLPLPVLLLLARVILTAKHLPNRWAWCAAPPWSPPVGTAVARWTTANTGMVLFWSTLALALPVIAVLNRDASLIQRTFQAGAGGLLFAALCAYALHIGTYRVWAWDAGVRECSAWGYREANWKDVRRIESKTVRQLRWSHYARRYQTSPWDRPSRKVVLLDAGGSTLLQLDRDLKPPDALAAILNLCRERTGLSFEQRQVDLRTDVI
jgi:hypothetical protein